MIQLGKIYVTHPERKVVGSLTYNQKAGNALVGLDLAALLPICRESELPEICAYVLPPIEKEKPFIQADIVVDLKRKRIKVGWVTTVDDAQGSVTYAVRLDREVILKRWNTIWIHLSPNNVPEEE